MNDKEKHWEESQDDEEYEKLLSNKLYDDCDKLIVIAENADRAFEMTKKYFASWQGDIHINEVNMTIEQVVLARYRHY